MTFKKRAGSSIAEGDLLEIGDILKMNSTLGDVLGDSESFQHCCDVLWKCFIPSAQNCFKCPFNEANIVSCCRSFPFSTYRVVTLKGFQPATPSQTALYQSHPLPLSEAFYKVFNDIETPNVFF